METPEETHEQGNITPDQHHKNMEKILTGMKLYIADVIKSDKSKIIKNEEVDFFLEMQETILSLQKDEEIDKKEKRVYQLLGSYIEITIQYYEALFSGKDYTNIMHEMVDIERDMCEHYFFSRLLYNYRIENNKLISAGDILDIGEPIESRFHGESGIDRERYSHELKQGNTKLFIILRKIKQETGKMGIDFEQQLIKHRDILMNIFHDTSNGHCNRSLMYLLIKLNIKQENSVRIILGT